MAKKLKRRAPATTQDARAERRQIRMMREPESGARHRPWQKRGLLVMRAVGGRLIRDPAQDLSDYVKASLAAPRRADCIVYDAAGVPVARIDGETRERTAL